MYAEPGRAPPPPRHAPSAVMVKTRKSQRNNNDIRVHEFCSEWRAAETSETAAAVFCVADIVATLCHDVGASL